MTRVTNMEVAQYAEDAGHFDVIIVGAGVSGIGAAYELALRQGFAAGWSGYAKAGSSFRLANFDENACFAPPCATALLEPQDAKTGELGVEYERSGLRGRAAIYQTRLEDEIYFSPAVFANVNLPPTRRRGRAPPRTTGRPSPAPPRSLPACPAICRPP